MAGQRGTMTQDEYRDLIDRVGARMGELRCGDLADSDLYTIEHGGERIRLPPQKHLVEMLEAFDRRLAILDRGLLDRANANLREVLRGEWPGRVVVERPRDEVAEEAPSVELANAPQLGDVRAGLQHLIAEIRADRGEPEPEPLA